MIQRVIKMDKGVIKGREKEGERETERGKRGKRKEAEGAENGRRDRTL